MKAAKLGAVFALTLVFLVAVLWGLELDKAAESLRTANWLWFLPMFLLYLAGAALRALRLWLLLDRSSPFLRFFSINAVGFLAINVMPLRLGEMVRPFLLLEKEGIPFSKGIAAILLERLLDMSMLLLLLLGLAWVVELPAQGLMVGGVDIVSVGQGGAGLLVAIGIAAGGCLVGVGEPAISLLERLPAGVRLAGFARSFREGLSTLFSHPLRALWHVLLSILIWSCTIFGVLCALLAFPGLPATIGASWTVWTAILAGMTAVPTPGFFGIYELCASAALWLYGTGETLAKTFAVALHLGQLAFIVVLGGTFLIREGLGLRDLARTDTSPE
jgi:glycosyltransferase 2 family protein